MRATETVSISEKQLVNFAFNKIELTDISKAKVKALIEQLKQASNTSIEVYTYTNDIGSNAYNLALSERRAKALELCWSETVSIATR